MITASKTRTLDPPFPNPMLIGVRLQLKVINLQLPNSSKDLTQHTDAVLLVLDLDLLLSQKLQQVLQRRRMTPPLVLRPRLDLRLRPDLYPKKTDVLAQTLARCNASSIATANSVQF